MFPPKQEIIFSKRTKNVDNFILTKYGAPFQSVFSTGAADRVIHMQKSIKLYTIWRSYVEKSGAVGNTNMLVM